MIFHLQPNIQRKIWGGAKLEKMKGAKPILGVDPIGETWEISTHKDGLSLINNKKIDGDLSYLVKLIDTGDELSVQVHPGDEYARLHENSLGKTECWVILSAEKNAGIFLGLKKGVTREVFLKALENKENMSLYLNFYPVFAGDFFYVPSGTIHAIGRGITMAEVQQSSGITYRVWDWNRVDSKGNPRELHVQKSLDVINFDEKANTPEYFKMQQGLFQKRGPDQIVSHDAFKLSLVNLKKDESARVALNSKTIPSLLNLQGRLAVNGDHFDSYSAALLKDEKEVLLKATTTTSVLIIE